MPMATITTTCTPAAVPQTTLSSYLRKATPMSYTLKELLSMDVEQLKGVCDKLCIDVPSSKPNQKQTREGLFYLIVTELSSTNQIEDTRTSQHDQENGEAMAAHGVKRMIGDSSSIDDLSSMTSEDSSVHEAKCIPSAAARLIHRDISVQEFRILEAIEFTQKVDDGSNPNMWPDADLILLGVSRSGKTPLSMFLAAQGYKVANFPLVQGASVPDQLFDFDQSRVVALVLDPDVLLSIRKKRAAMMGLNERSAAYVDVERIEDELSWVKNMYRQHPQWTLLDVTFRGVEETASKILRVMHQKHPDRFRATLESSPCQRSPSAPLITPTRNTSMPLLLPPRNSPRPV